MAIKKLNFFLVRASIVVLVALLCIQIQHIEAKVTETDVEKSTTSVSTTEHTTTVRQKLHYHKQ